MKRLIFLFSLLFTFSAYAQSLSDLDSYRIDEVYAKKDVPYGTLDEDGDDIDHIFVRTDLDPGLYEIDLTDGEGDLYEVKGTNIYIEFVGYFGYAGYSTECYLEVNNYGGGTVYKRED